jgi:hypothetical protein
MLKGVVSTGKRTNFSEQMSRIPDRKPLTYSPPALHSKLKPTKILKGSMVLAQNSKKELQDRSVCSGIRVMAHCIVEHNAVTLTLTRT